jgi:hypothetical protein
MNLRTVFVFVLFVLACSILKAQSEKAVYVYGEFKEGAVVHIFGDKVNIRSGPSVSEKIVATLSAGTPVTIIKKTDVSFKINDYQANWYEISFYSGTVLKNAYVWGGLLALASFEIPNSSGGKNNLAVYGITAFDSKAYDFSSQLRIIHADTIYTSLTFDAIYSPLGGDDGKYGYCVEADLLGNCGFSSISNIIKLEYIYGACGFNNGNVLVFWDGKKLTFGLNIIKVSEAGIYNYNYDLIYPDQKEGKPDKLLVKRNIINYDENLTVTRDTIYFEEYKWDKTSLSKTTE